MRLLLDQNLSRRLVGMLVAEYPDSCHVVEVGLDTATDRAIWEHARDHGFAIVSKDSDFRQLAFLLGPPPKVIWLRIGNATTLKICRHGVRRCGGLRQDSQRGPLGGSAGRDATTGQAIVIDGGLISGCNLTGVPPA